MRQIIYFSFTMFLLLFFSSCMNKDKLANDLQEKKEVAVDTVLNNWSKKSPNSMNWSDAKKYCENLNEDGHSDWRLPTISELRTLIKNCPATETDGACMVTNDCLHDGNCRTSACNGCSGGSDGRYSKFGDTKWLWSSSEPSDITDRAWVVIFKLGLVNYGNKSGTINVRCVK
jgi:hypothetical protein